MTFLTADLLPTCALNVTVTFVLRLICREYAFQLGTVARDTYVSKMRGSWVIIEMVMGRRSKKKNRQLYLARLSWEPSKYTHMTHGGTKCANVHSSRRLCPFSLWIFFCLCCFFVCISENAKYLFACAWPCLCVCVFVRAPRHTAAASELTADF